MTNPTLATPTEVAEYLGVPPATLAQWRYLGKGPRYSRVGRYVRYVWDDVHKFVADQSSDPADVDQASR